MSRSPLERAIERELIEGLGPRRRRSLLERLRGNPRERQNWDRAIAAFRALEQRSVSRFEIEQVERWLLDDLAGEGVIAAEPSRGFWRRWTWLGASLATLATAGLLLWWGNPATDDNRTIIDDELVARGNHGFDRPLAIELVCGQPPRPASARGCSLDETLGFSARLGLDTRDADPEQVQALASAPLHLSLFGVDAAGEPRFYLPTPDETALPTLALDSGWQALPRSVRLAVNHEAGRVRVYAIASDRPASVADIERWAAALRDRPLAGVDDPPWHLRLSPAQLGGVCPNPRRCASAESEFHINPTTLQHSP